MFKSKSSVSSRSTFSVEDDNSVDFDKWKIPKLSTKEIYTTSWLESVFKAEYAMKTAEQTFAISSNNEKYELFDKKIINDALVKGYKVLHIGAVQVAFKPLARLDSTNASVLLRLRDPRFVDFQTSILGMIQSSLFNGPIHFDIFPDSLIYLDDVRITKGLTLDVLTSGCDMEEGRRPLAIFYRTYYKLLKAFQNPHAVVKSSGNSTMLIQSSTQDANIYVPKMMRWNEIDVPNEWLLENVFEPA
jgi:hypothetical protein